MANTWTTFFNALIEVCEEYNKTKTKVDEKIVEQEFFSDIFAEPVVDKSNVVNAMAEHGWSSFDMKMVLRYVSTPEQAKTAIELVNRGYGWNDVRDIVRSID